MKYLENMTAFFVRFCVKKKVDTEGRRSFKEDAKDLAVQLVVEARVGEMR